MFHHVSNHMDLDSMGAVSTAPPIDFQKYILTKMKEEKFYTFYFHVWKKIYPTTFLDQILILCQFLLNSNINNF